MLTARADLADKLHALRMGVDDYMLKPFDEEELAARVENLLRFAALRSRNPKASVEKPGHANPVSDTAGDFEPSTAHFLSETNMSWLKALEELTRANLENPFLSVEFLAERMNISSRHLQRQLKSISGLTMNQYLQEARLQYSRHLLERSDLLVKQVSAKVGYKDTKHFARLYRERFGKSPSTDS
jgi:transcriptional regulator GlxA family with amidase domain